MGKLNFHKIITQESSFGTALAVLFFILLAGCSPGAVNPPAWVNPTLPPKEVEAIPIYSCEQIRDVFSYNPQPPLDLHEISSDQKDGAVVIELTYASPLGGQVPATLVLPQGSGPFAGLLYQHGMPATRHSLVPAAITYARMGAVVLLIDAPFARRENGLNEPLTFTEQDRLEQIQLIIDLRRGVDLLLSRPEVDPQRLGYIGVSYGGAMGGLLAGVEDRLKAYVLQVGDGGLVTHFTGPEDSRFWLAKPEAVRQQWLTWMWPIEPIHYVGCAAPSALLFQNGTLDAMVPPADALVYQQAGNEPKTTRWYKDGHALGMSAGRDQAKWLSQTIGISSRRALPRSIEMTLTIWGIVTVGALGYMVWELWKKRPASHGVRLAWLITTLFLGVLGVANYWICNVARSMDRSSPARQALGLAAWAASRNGLGGMGVLALLFYFPQTFGANIIGQIAITFLLPFCTSWFISILSRWISRSQGENPPTYPYPISIEIISTCLVLAGVYPTVNMLIARWLIPWTSPFSIDLIYPPLWFALSLGVLVGVLIVYLFYLGMLKNEVIQWRAAAPSKGTAAAAFAWYMQAGLVVFSFVFMLAAIYLSTRITQG